MKTLLLFGGGDEGGLLITEHGVRPIPPFDAAIRLTLKSAAAMVNAVTAEGSKSHNKKLATLATSLTNQAVDLVEQVLGPLDAERAIVYQDADGGFTCGSNGKPPIAIVWPPRSLPSAPELIAAGVVEPDMVEFLRQARLNKVKITDIFEKPTEIAKQLGVPLSDKTASDLQSLAPSKVTAFKDDKDRELIGFFHAVVKDGRYMDGWFTRPYEVSQALKVELSDEALERLAAGGAGAAFFDRGPTQQVNPIAIVGLAILVIIVVIWAFSEVEDFVADRSGLDKI